MNEICLSEHSRKLFEEFKMLLNVNIHAELDREAFLEKFDRNSRFLVDAVEDSRKNLLEFVFNMIEENQSLRVKEACWKS